MRTLNYSKWFFFLFYFSGAGPDPNARSFNPGKFRQQAVVSQSVLLPESLIWTYVIQMTSALRHIHSAGLACRTLDPTKILIINKTRLLLNCCGIFDVLTFDPTSSNPMAAMAHYQQEDLIALGKMVLGMFLRFKTIFFILHFWQIHFLFRSSCMQFILGRTTRESSNFDGSCYVDIQQWHEKFNNVSADKSDTFENR